MKYTIYNSDGSIDRKLDISPDEIHLNLGEGQNFIEEWYPEDEYYIVNGEAVAKEPRPGTWARFDYGSKFWFDPRSADDLLQELVLTKANAIATINKAIGVVRSGYITVLPAQEMIYQAKENEAKAFLADPDPVSFDYPLLHAEIGITGDSAQQIAQIFLNMADGWRRTASILENLRLGYIARIEHAQNIDQVESVLQNFQNYMKAMQ